MQRLAGPPVSAAGVSLSRLGRSSWEVLLQCVGMLQQTAWWISWHGCRAMNMVPVKPAHNGQTCLSVRLECAQPCTLQVHLQKQQAPCMAMHVPSCCQTRLH